MLFQLDGRYWIKTDNTAIPVVQESCFDDCIEILFFTFFVFSVSYPPELKIVYALLERVMHIKTTMKRSVTLDDFAQAINMWTMTPLDNTWAVMVVWRIRGNMRTVVCCIVQQNCAQYSILCQQIRQLQTSKKSGFLAHPVCTRVFQCVH